MGSQNNSLKSAFPKPIYLAAAVRSPIGKFGGTLKGFSAPELAALSLTECKRRSGVTNEPDMILLGHARQAGTGPNPARQIVFGAGLPESVPAMTINQACASGLTSIMLAAEKIALGRAHSIFAGGVESMSNTPYFLSQSRWGQKMGNTEVVDGMYKDGFLCPMSQMVMGETVEKFLAQELGISRAEQDQYALQSQKRADHAWRTSAFLDETFDIKIKQKGGDAKLYREDEHRRGDCTLEMLTKLAPVFDMKTGTVTAGNSSGITDGSAFVHVTDEKTSSVMAEILDFETIALDPRKMGLGPVPATQKLLARQGLTVQDLDAVELNEAFAAQVIACQRALKIPEEKLNMRGGAIALGHPIGCTGTRIAVTLMHILKGKTGALGLATLCVSGGHGVAMLFRMT